MTCGRGIALDQGQKGAHCAQFETSNTKSESTVSMRLVSRATGQSGLEGRRLHRRDLSRGNRSVIVCASARRDVLGICLCLSAWVTASDASEIASLAEDPAAPKGTFNKISLACPIFICSVSLLLCAKPGVRLKMHFLCSAYVENARMLVNALSESIELEGSGASELEVGPEFLGVHLQIFDSDLLAVPQVRRKADPVKDLVKEFIGTWRDNKLVQASRARLPVCVDGDGSPQRLVCCRRVRRRTKRSLGASGSWGSFMPRTASAARSPQR